MARNNAPDDLSDLPVNPAPDQLLDLYKKCREKLVSANRSRSSLKGHDKRRSALISELQQQLCQLESSLHDEAATRLRIHELNSRIAEIVTDLEAGIEEVAEIVEQKGANGLTSWVVRFAKLLPIALRLRDVKSSALRLLRRDSEIPEIAGLVFSDQEVLPEKNDQLNDPVPQISKELLPDGEQEQLFQPVAEESNGHQFSNEDICFGAFVLKDLTDAYGLLLLHQKDGHVPTGFCVVHDSPWLPDVPLLALDNLDDPSDGPVEAALEALADHDFIYPSLKPWFDKGILPFALDNEIKQLRLLPLSKLEHASHVLVSQQYGEKFKAADVPQISLDLDDEIWIGFSLSYAEDKAILLSILNQSKNNFSSRPRLSTRGGVRMPEGQGYLATGLGLPMLGVPLEISANKVELILNDGSILFYYPIKQDAQDHERRLFDASFDDRRRSSLAPGMARFVVSSDSGEPLERLVQFSSLPLHVTFQRTVDLAFREDWGLVLGPLHLSLGDAFVQQADKGSRERARQRLNRGDLNVNPLFEQQMLESLCALFQRRASIQRFDFYSLYSQLRNKPEEWEGFPEAVLRGWCEGGWIEEGVERGRGRWRIQPVDPRFVRIAENKVQLVGLLTARRLVEVLAWADQLSLNIQTVQPSCPDMPRGWRFSGEIERLGVACCLPIVDLDDWIPDPIRHHWMIEDPLPSDSPPWPTGVNSRIYSDPICGRRGPNCHWMPAERFPERGRAPISQTIQAETSSYGKRRWLSHDPINGSLFSSCHRNRVSLHALIVATDGYWPFGFTDYEKNQIDRLYDSDSYLPLPLGRYAALVGKKLPGPTRREPQNHTYRYYFDYTFRQSQFEKRIFPLTPISTSR